MKETFVESPDRAVPQDVVMDCLQVDSKNLTTRAVQGASKTASVVKNKCVYRNIRKSISFTDASTSQSGGTKATNIDSDTLISQLKNKLTLLECKVKAKNTMDNIMSVVEGKECDKSFLKALLHLYNHEMEQVSSISEQIDMEYEKELRILTEKKTDTLLSSSDIAILAQEWESLSGIVDFGIRSGENLSSIENITGEVFTRLQIDFDKNCPFLTDLIRTLLGSDEKCGKKQKGTVHALSLLMSLRSQKCRNDIMLFFTLMLISYGAGYRLINMLNKIGLTVHWSTVMNFLDKQLTLLEKSVQSKTPLQVPLILLMDNINIYRGNQRYHRLFKDLGSNMWNFTGKGLLIPNIEGIEDLFLHRETALQSQHDVTSNSFTYENLILHHHPELEKLWLVQKDNYLINLLRDGINFVASATKPIKNMTETDCNTFLKSKGYTGEAEATILTNKESNAYISRSSVKTQTIILPLSLEDNSTLSGTGAILDEFGRKFGIPVDSQKEYLPFDKQTKTFCIKQAREHCEFISMLKFQKDNLNISEHETFEDSDEDETDETMNGKDNLNTREPSSCVTLESMREVFHSHDSLFKSTYDSLHTKVWNAVHSNSMKRLVEDLSQQSGVIINIKDHLGRTLLHDPSSSEKGQGICRVLDSGWV